MFVKFRRDVIGSGVSDVQGRLDKRVVPSESVIFETPYVRYTKLPCPILEECMYSPCHMIFNDPTKVEGECLEVRIRQDGKPLWLYVVDGSSVERHLTMFIMNDQGKTIDSISCV